MSGNAASERTVALAAAPGSALSLAPLVALVGAGHRIVSWHDRPVGPVHAVVASDPDVLSEVLAAPVGPGGASGHDAAQPLAVCQVVDEGERARAAASGAVAAFTGSADLVVADAGPGGMPTVHAPAQGVDLSRYPVLPPLVRARMRQAFGLPDPLVLAVTSSAHLTDRTTSLALASAAVVEPDLLPLALALGTPSVVDRATAESSGLLHRREVVVAASPSERDALAAALARDEVRCAALSRSARAHAERHLDLGGAVRALRRALGLEPPPALIDLRLEELATPAGSRLRDRTSHALALFTSEHAP